MYLLLRSKNKTVQYNRLDYAQNIRKYIARLHEPEVQNQTYDRSSWMKMEFKQATKYHSLALVLIKQWSISSNIPKVHEESREYRRTPNFDPILPHRPWGIAAKMERIEAISDKALRQQ